MNTMHWLFITPGDIFLLLFWSAWWFKLLLCLFVSAAAVIFHFIKIRKLKHQHADTERQLLERNELLQYSKKNEQKANEKVTQSDSSKTILLSKINHEVRTPMNGILGMATLLDQTDLTPEQKEYNGIILSCGKSLLRVANEIMMNDILEYSKVDSGKELEAKDFDLCQAIEEVLEVFAARAAKNGIELLYYAENNIPSQIVGDIRRLRQVLTNLVENSIRVTAAGEIFIGVKLLECREDNQIKLEFEVRDTGTGITADKLKSISDNFARKNAPGKVNEATGVGLIICKKLVELMGGSIKVDSHEKEGTTFTFAIYTKAGMQPSRTHTHSGAACYEDKKILIVADNAMASEVLKKQVENLKMIASPASSSYEALEILTQVSFDLVIMDLNMPDMDGIQLASCIRKKYPLLPLVLLNPVNDEKHKQCTEIFDEVLNKPVKQHKLQNAFLSQFRHKDKPVKNESSVAHKLSENFSVQYPLNILIAEDNPVNQKWTTKTLSKLGYHPEVVVNGKEALEAVSSKQYDLILMDVQMPEMDGMEATRMIRLCLETQPVIIAMTANAMQGDRQDCIQSGMDDYISKPVELNDLVGMLEKWGSLIKGKKQPSLLAKSVER